MKIFKTPAQQMREREHALNRLIRAGDAFSNAISAPIRMADEIARRNPQPTFLESLRTGRKADCPL